MDAPIREIADQAGVGLGTLPAYFDRRLRPPSAPSLMPPPPPGAVRTDVDADDLLGAVASLCMPAHDTEPGRAERMVGVLVDGMRYG